MHSSPEHTSHFHLHATASDSQLLLSYFFVFYYYDLSLFIYLHNKTYFDLTRLFSIVILEVWWINNYKKGKVCTILLLDDIYSYTTNSYSQLMCRIEERSFWHHNGLMKILVIFFEIFFERIKPYQWTKNFFQLFIFEILLSLHTIHL